MPIEFDQLPGYQVRRLHQIAVALFLEEMKLHGITPVQYGALSAVARQPGTDQRGLARAIGIDTSTIGSVVDRLEARGLMARSANPDDRRVRLLSITPEGQRLLSAVEPGLLRTQERLLAPLPVTEQAKFMKMLTVLVEGNSAVSRAPSASDGTPGETSQTQDRESGAATEVSNLGLPRSRRRQAA